MSRHRLLFPKAKLNRYALPLLMRYGDQVGKLLDFELVRKDRDMVAQLLGKYCDCNSKGKPHSSYKFSPDYLRLPDGRVIELIDILDAVWDSAERQQATIKKFLQERGEDIEQLKNENAN